MLLCGHNICRTCLNSYSSTNHPKSSIRCEVCNLETKVLHLTMSKPNIEISRVIISIQEFLSRDFQTDLKTMEPREESKGKLPTYEISSRAIGEAAKISEETSRKISVYTSQSSIAQKENDQ